MKLSFQLENRIAIRPTRPARGPARRRQARRGQMCLKVITEHYGAGPFHGPLLRANFNLHVNVVNFHIIKIHEAGKGAD